MPSELGLLESLLAASHLAAPDQTPNLIDSHSVRLGARQALLYLVDLEQRWLVPLPAEGGPPGEELSIDGTLAGRCFRSMAVFDTVHDTGERTVWIPVVDGTERLGVLQLSIAGGGEVDVEEAKAFAGLIAELIMSKSAYGDAFEVARRRRPLTVAAELVWQLMPPLTFGCEGLVIAAAVVPTADLGGDAFDYGVDSSRAQVAIFDGMGHGLAGGLLTTTAVAAYRNSRRSGLDLADAAAHIGRTIRSHFGASRFVTGVLASVDTETGRFSWCVAGHPPPLLLRRGRVVKDLEHQSGQPFGIGPASTVFQERLQPGDRILLYTDGVTEARTASGDFFGLDQLTALVSRTAGDDPPPETMRRLMHAIEDHNDGPMRDDATVVMIEWRGPGSAQLQV